MTTTLTEAAVGAAATTLVDAFARTDTEAYFGCFSEDASFVFYPEPARLNDRASYEALWKSWLADGWRVEECESTDRLIRIYGDVGVFSHSVRTVTSIAEDRSETRERETIVFALVEGNLLAVHEHLSPLPND